MRYAHPELDALQGLDRLAGQRKMRGMDEVGVEVLDRLELRDDGVVGVRRPFADVAPLPRADREVEPAGQGGNCLRERLDLVALAESRNLSVTQWISIATSSCGSCAAVRTCVLSGDRS